MYVCMYVLYAYIRVCLHLCVYACMYICMHVCLHVCIYVIFKLGFERYGGNCLSWEGNCPGNCPGENVRAPVMRVYSFSDHIFPSAAYVFFTRSNVKINL